MFYVLLVVSGFLNAQDFVWAEIVGGEGEDVTRAMTVDGEGNSYLTGYFSDTSYFGSGTHEVEVVSNGAFDIFVTKTSPSGELLWVKAIGADSDDYGTGIKVDENGNVFVTGVYQNTVNFNPQDEYLMTSTGFLDIFIMKLDSEGDFQWAKSVGGIEYEESTGIGTDADGNVYVGGYFYNEMDFDPSDDEFTMEPNGIGDGFVMKLNNEGNFQWAKRIADGFSLLLSMEVMPDGQIFAAGNFQDSCDFDPSDTGEFIVTAGEGSMDIFVLQLDNMGDFINVATSRGTDGQSTTVDIAVDNERNAYVTGYFGGTIDFAPNEEHGGEHTYTTGGFLNAYMMKVKNNGDLGWVKHITSVDTEASSNGYGVAVNSQGESFLTGYFALTVNFDDITLTPQSTNAMDAFLAKLDSEGNFVSAVAVGGGNFVEEHSVRLDDEGNIYLSGTFETNVDLNPDANETYEVESRGFRDTYLIKFTDESLGLNENFSQNRITIYPNPSDGVFFLQSTVELAGKDFSINDLTGRKITTGKISQQQEIQLNDLPRGIYILNVDKQSFKIIKK